VLILFEDIHPGIAPMAEQAPDYPGRMVVVYGQPFDLMADGTSAALPIDQRLILLLRQAIPGLPVPAQMGGVVLGWVGVIANA
jgi:hypothetical protein